MKYKNFFVQIKYLNLYYIILQRRKIIRNLSIKFLINKNMILFYK